MLSALFVGIGGFTGSVMRYMVGLAVMRFAINHPAAGTFAVNVSGCLFIGLLGGMAETKGLLDNNLRLLLITGFLGGFTTFSSFGFETLKLFNDSHVWLAAGNVVITLVTGLVAAAIGFKAASLV